MHKKPTDAHRVRADGAKPSEVRSTPMLTIQFAFGLSARGHTLDLAAIDEEGYVVGHQPYDAEGARAIRGVLDTWLAQLEGDAPAATTARLDALAHATPGLVVEHGPLAQMGDKGDN